MGLHVARDPGRARGGATCLVLLLAGAALLAGCARSQDSRVAQMINQRGFGRKFVGDSNELYYLGIGDSIAIVDPLHPELQGVYTVGPDGMITIMYVGEVFVGGMTVADVTELLNRRFRVIIDSADVQVNVLRSNSKYYYVMGEVARKGVVPFRGDQTLFDVVTTNGPTLMANQRKIRLIRPDPVHPFVMEFDYRDMVTRGVSGNNVLVRENDIIYVPPNLLGRISRVLETLTAPLVTIVSNVILLNNLRVTTQSFADQDRFIYGGYGGGLGGFGRRGRGRGAFGLGTGAAGAGSSD